MDGHDPSQLKCWAYTLSVALSRKPVLLPAQRAGVTVFFARVDTRIIGDTNFQHNDCTYSRNLWLGRLGPSAGGPLLGIREKDVKANPGLVSGHDLGVPSVQDENL